MDPQVILTTLSNLDDTILQSVLIQLVQSKPTLAPGLVSVCVPDLTFAPSKSFTEKRCIGTVKLNPAMGVSFISCPDLSAVFDCEVQVRPQQVAGFVDGQEVNFAVTLNEENKPQAFDLIDNKMGLNGVASMGGCGGGCGMPSMGDPMSCGMGGCGMGGCGCWCGCGYGGGCGSGCGGCCGSCGGCGCGCGGCGGNCSGCGGNCSGCGCNCAGCGCGCGCGGCGGCGSCGGCGGCGGCGCGCSGCGCDGNVGGPDMGMMGRPMGMMPGPGPPSGHGMKGGGKHNEESLGEFFGVVKSYNPDKGFGFIACDALKGQHGDVYLNSRNIGDFKVGQEVKFQAFLHNGRLQGRDLRDATGQVGRQSGAAGAEEQELGVFAGKIKNFNQEKGFGFIVCDALATQGFQGDVFLHQKHKGEFKEGDYVAFMAVLRNGKLQAKDLEPAPENDGGSGMGMGTMSMGSPIGGPMGGMGGPMGPMGDPGCSCGKGGCKGRPGPY